MKSYRGITLRYQKIQKRRTFLTILGIILSAALISGIGTIGLSFLEKMFRDTIAVSGDYYASISNIDHNRIEKMRKHILAGNVGVEVYQGFVSKRLLCDQSAAKSEFKGYHLLAYDRMALSMLPIKLKTGRMPRNNNEIVIGSGTLQFLKNPPQIGEQIQFEIAPGIDVNGKFDADGKQYLKEYTVVGYLDSWASYPFRMNAISFFNTADLKQRSHNKVYLKVKNANRIRENIQQIIRDIGLEKAGEKPTYKVAYNQPVLRLLFQSDHRTNTALIGSLVFLAMIVIVSMVAVIYNTFNISIFERISQYGLLRCVGATPSQIRRLVYIEAAILGGVGIPVGILLGTLTMQGLFSLLRLIAPDLPYGDLRLIISPAIIGVSFLLSFVAVLFSALGPAKKASRISPMEAVKNSGSLKKEKFSKVASAKFTKVLFGAEGWMAKKNLGRNRTRLYITVLSMAISITLFIVFSSLIDLAYKVGIDDSKNEMVNFTIQSKVDYYGDITITPQEVKEFKKLPEVKRVFTYYKQWYQSGGEVVLLPREKVNRRLEKSNPQWFNEHLQEPSYVKFDKSHVLALGDEETFVLNQYLESGKIDIAAMNRENGVIVVNTGNFVSSTKNKMVLKTVLLKPGDHIKVKAGASDAKARSGFTEYKVMGVLHQGIWGEKFNDVGGINLYTTERNYKKFTSVQKQPHMLLIQVDKGRDTKQLKACLQSFVQKYPDSLFNDYDQQMRQYFQSNFIICIFIYGFFGVIALIGCVNIVNTISTNIILRTKELAILKAIGMTQSGIKKLVCLESIFYGIFACLLGTALGTLFSLSLYKLFYKAVAVEWSIPWNFISIAVMGTLTVTIIAGYLPLKKINNAMIVENIRQEQ